MDNVDRDEPISWLAAFILMGFATIFTVLSRILAFDPFTTVFDLFIVYLPSAVLLVGVLLQRRHQKTIR